jgi:hypothetical protein
MNTDATHSATISGLLSLVEALEPTDSGARTPDLSEVLGPVTGGWLAVKDDGHGWMLLQLSPRPENAGSERSAVVETTGTVAGRAPAASTRH